MPHSPVVRQGKCLSAATRTVSVATLAIFLLTQLWVVCPAMCFLHGHSVVAMSGSSDVTGRMDCHGDRAVRNDIPPPAPPGPMLPASTPVLLGSLPVVAMELTPLPVFQLQQPPSADTPPPRLG